MGIDWRNDALGSQLQFDFAVLLGRRHVLWRSTEARSYFIGLSLASLLVMGTSPVMPRWSPYDGNVHDIIRDSIFQVVSILTTTGYATGYDAHPSELVGFTPAAIALLALLMPIGGCAGSTSGGIKVVRFLARLACCPTGNSVAKLNRPACPLFASIISRLATR